MTPSTKVFIALCLIAIGLFGVAYYDVFAYTRTPAGDFIAFSAETGHPVQFDLDGGDYNPADPCEALVRMELTAGGFSLNGEWIVEPTGDQTQTFYNLPAGNYTAQWVFYQSNQVSCGGGYVVPVSPDTFTVTGLVSITYPVNGASYTTEPNHFSVAWSLDSSYATASYRYKDIEIRYGKDPFNLSLQAFKRVDNIATDSFESYIPKLTNLDGGTTYARAFILFSGDNITFDRAIYSEIVHWEVAEPASESVPLTDFGVFGNAIRDVALWLAIPPSTSFNQFATLRTTLLAKPPLGYFQLLRNDFDALSSASATVTWDLTPVEPITTPLKAGIAVMLLILWAVWAILRLTKWDWHL